MPCLKGWGVIIALMLFLSGGCAAGGPTPGEKPATGSAPATTQAKPNVTAKSNVVPSPDLSASKKAEPESARPETPKPPPASPLPPNPFVVQPPAPAPAAPVAAPTAAAANGPAATPTATKSIGPVKVQSPAVSDTPVPGVVLRFDNADIYEVLQAVLGDMLHLNYLVEPGVQGKVTINTSGTISESDIFNILQSILQLNNISIIRDGKLYKVVRDPDVHRDTVGFEAVGEGSPLIQIVPLRFVQGSALINVLKGFVGSQALITNDPTNKYLIISDRASNVIKILEMLKVLDVDYLQHVKIKLVQIEKGDATEMAKEMESLFKTSGLFNWPGTEGNKVFFLPIKRMNSLLVAAANEAVLEAAERWIKTLDDEPKDGVGSFIHVHPVQNSNALHIASILRQIYGGAPITPAGVEPSKVVIKGAVPTEGAATTASGQGLAGTVQIIPDEATNTLVIKASPQDYLQIQKVIERIDTVPRQVLIQVMVAEVTLNDETQFGVEWWLQKNKFSVGGTPRRADVTLDSGLLAPGSNPLTSALPAGVSSGLNYLVFNGVGDVVGLFNALGATTNVNLLSAPHILASDGKEAKIEVGSDEPVVTQTVSTPTATTATTATLATSNSVQYRPTGILLEVKPHVNASGLVSLSVSQEVSNRGVDVPVGGTTYPSFSKRKVNTEVTLEEGKTLLIAGLIQDNTNNSNVGVPGLKDIPLLGYLFGTKDNKRNKTELMVTITPYVVRNREEGDRITASFQDNLKDLKILTRKVERLESGVPPSSAQTGVPADAAKGQ
jgi:general secretion pathway protein D